MKDYSFILCLLVFVVVLPLGLFGAWLYCTGVSICDSDNGNWLSFWGGVLALSGTCFLGAVALLQNTRLLNFERIRHSCNVVLKTNDVLRGVALATRAVPGVTGLTNEHNPPYGASGRYVTFTIINHSDALLKKIRILFPGNIEFSSHITLAKGEERNVMVAIPQNLNVALDALEPDELEQALNEMKMKIYFLSCNDMETHGSFKFKPSGVHFTRKHYHFYGLK